MTDVAFHQKCAAEASAAARWEFEHGGISRAPMMQERAAWLAEYARDAMAKWQSAIYEHGLITAPREVHDLISAHWPNAYKITSFQNGRSPMTSAGFYAMCRARGIVAESIFDARHGRRYMCFAYRTREERKACWDAHTGGKD